MGVGFDCRTDRLADGGALNRVCGSRQILKNVSLSNSSMVEIAGYFGSSSLWPATQLSQRLNSARNSTNGYPMNTRQKLLSDLKMRKVSLLTFVLLSALAGCVERSVPSGPLADAVKHQDGNLVAQPAKEDLRRFGKSVAARLASQKIDFVDVRDGVDSATVDPADGPGLSIFFIAFSAPRSSEFQMTGKISTPKLSPENLLRQQSWQSQVCTSELAEIMRERSIDIVYATFGKVDMPIAQCQQQD